MNGSEVKKMIMESDVHIWQVADKWGVAEATFSRRLRRPFSQEEVERIKEIIDELKK